MANILSIGQGFPTSIVRYQFSPAVGKTFAAGDLVYQLDASTVDYATLADGDDYQVYTVLEGNDTYSGSTTKKVVCIAGVFSFSSQNYQTGSYTVGTPLTADTGKFAIKTGTKKVLGHVMDFSISNGVKVLWFSA